MSRPTLPTTAPVRPRTRAPRRRAAVLTWDNSADWLRYTEGDYIREALRLDEDRDDRTGHPSDALSVHALWEL